MKIKIIEEGTLASRKSSQKELSKRAEEKERGIFLLWGLNIFPGEKDGTCEDHLLKVL